MAFVDPAHDITEDDLKALRREVGQLLYNTPGQKEVKKIGLGESFAIWRLDPEHFISASPALPGKPTAYRHYQVYLDRTPRAHVVVQQVDGKSRIYDVVASTLAEQIDQAIDVVDEIDKQDKDQTPVHYLVAFCCNVHAFQLVHNDIIYVISAPAKLVGLPEEKRLIAGTLLSTTEFLNRLRKLYERLRSNRKLERDY